jgi:hypothetical protein
MLRPNAKYNGLHKNQYQIITDKANQNYQNY